MLLKRLPSFSAIFSEKYLHKHKLQCAFTEFVCIFPLLVLCMCINLLVQKQQKRTSLVDGFLPGYVSVVQHALHRIHLHLRITERAHYPVQVARDLQQKRAVNQIISAQIFINLPKPIKDAHFLPSFGVAGLSRSGDPWFCLPNLSVKKEMCEVHPKIL